MEGMKEYVERTAALDATRRAFSDQECDCEVMPDVFRALKDIPAADVAEVRHGQWIGLEYDGYADGNPVYDLWECSECGEEVRGEDVPVTHPWCHCCGARMDKEDKHEAG